MTEPKLKQQARPLFFIPPSDQPEDLFALIRFTGKESISSLFSYTLELVSEETSIDPANIVGKQVSFGFKEWEWTDETPDAVEEQHYHGVVSWIRAGNSTQTGRQYLAEVVPAMWFLTLATNSRVFQNNTVKEIISQVLGAYGITDCNDDFLKSTKKLEYCVQYQETDFAFLSRIMEKEGVFYFFEHSDTAHTLHVSDDAAAFTDAIETQLSYRTKPLADLPQFDRMSDVLLHWEHHYEYRTETWTLTDYNCIDHFAGTQKTPSSILEVSDETSSDFTSQVQQKLEVFEYPGGYQKKEDGTTLAALRIDAEKARAHYVRGDTTCCQLAVGNKIIIKEHEEEEENDKVYIVTSYQCKNVVEESGAESFTYSFECIPDDAIPRPLRHTPLPRIHGVQAALVVGPDGEEIHTDEHSRIKVQFFWDRTGVRDGTNACWVRCAQSIAGKSWGSIFIPRIGQEVVVTFLDGDPDRPLVTGVVYNGEQTPPYDLPANQTQSGLKTMSSLKGTTDTYNELRFEDKKDEEEIYFHAEKDFTRVVENNDSLTVGLDKKDKGNQSVEIFNNQDITIGCSDAEDGSRTLTVWKNNNITIQKGDETIVVDEGNRTVTITKGNQTLDVKEGNRVVTIDKGNDQVTVTQGDQTIKVTAGAMTHEAGKSILLKVGTNSITIDSKGIKMVGMAITMEGKATFDAKALESKVTGTASLALKGGTIKIN